MHQAMREHPVRPRKTGQGLGKLGEAGRRRSRLDSKEVGPRGRYEKEK